MPSSHEYKSINEMTSEEIESILEEVIIGIECLNGEGWYEYAVAIEHLMSMFSELREENRVMISLLTQLGNQASLEDLNHRLKSANILINRIMELSNRLNGTPYKSSLDENED